MTSPGLKGFGVAFVLASYAPDTPAGMERATAALIEGLRAIGHRTIIISASTRNQPASAVIRLSSLALQFPADDDTLRQAIKSAEPAIRAELTHILDRHEIDVAVYVDALWGLGRVMADQRACRVLAAHVLGHAEDMRPALASADRVVAPSSAVLREAGQRGYATDKWEVVPNALLHERLPVATEERERLRLDGPVRVLARPAADKGVPDLLEATPTRLTRSADVVLARAPFEVGSGAQLALTARSKRAGGPQVRVSDRPLPWRHVPTWLGEAAVVIVPSHAETFGLVALEAMNCGTPVVAYDVGNLPELIGRGDDAGGIIVKRAAGPAELWRAALALLQDRVTYLHTSRAAYYRSRDFRPTSIAELFMKAVW